MKNPYIDMNNISICDIAVDYLASIDSGKRCESFVPYAKEIYKNINGTNCELVTLRECLDIAKQDFIEIILSRFIDSIEKISEICYDEDEKEVI